MNKNKKSVFYVVLCHIYEHYENSLFSFAAPFLLDIFFQKHDETDRIGIYLAMAAGFWMRPIGAFVISSIGDIKGRRKALMYSLSLCFLPSLGVCFLPTYAAWGAWSSLILVCIRLIQGLAVGGGFYSTLTFISESNIMSRKNLLFGISLSAGFFGSVFGVLCASFFLATDLPDGSWRMPFMIAAVYGMALVLMRKTVGESEIWKKAPRSSSFLPFAEALRHYRSNVFAVFFIGMGTLAPFYLATSWLPSYMVDFLHHQPTDILMATSILFVVSGCSIILFSWLTAWIRLKTMMVIFCALSPIICGILLYGFKTQDHTLLWAAQVIIALYTGLAVAPSLLLIQVLFPVQYKFSGFAIPFSIGQAAFLGSTPLLCEMIIRITGDAAYTCLIILMAAVFIAIAALLATPYEECKKQPS